ncbi:hypothetical protein [Acidianus manzaensis]|uniref:hypothetical protein n=1 Tax=Acidianus manzaensis TaxID=282676 RepID=UPI001F27117A|nr:hypothetical protein [Acidianus manzaensis]
MRQMRRGEIDQNTGKLLLSKLKGKKLEEALELLGYFKWLYEALDTEEARNKKAEISKVKDFKGVVEVLSR